MCDKNLVFPAVFQKDGGAYMVTFPDLDGCFSSGDNIAEAFLNARDALALYIHDNDKLPLPSKYEDIACDKDEYLMLVAPDETDNIEYFKNVDIADILKKALANKGLTKYKVAKLLGISESYVNRIISGERKPSTEVAQKVAELLEFDWRLFYV